MKKSKPTATIEMHTGARVVIELDPDSAPNTVKNFISLANSGFYNGLSFHRVIPGFMIQGGCPLGNGTGGPGYSIKGEFSSNGLDNKIKHKRGVVSMARSQDYDSAGSQFFIVVKNASHLDGEYASFGRVTDGMKEVDRVVNAPSDHRDKPLEAEIIKAITVNTDGLEYEEPDKL